MNVSEVQEVVEDTRHVVFDGASYAHRSNGACNSNAYHYAQFINNADMQSADMNESEDLPTGQFEIHLSKEDENGHPIVTDKGGVLDLDMKKLKKRKSLAGTCQICKKRYANLNHHMRIHSENRKRSHVCRLCGKGFYTKQTLSFHMESHPVSKPFNCADCGKAFYSEMCLSAHIRNSHSGAFLCSYCGKTLGSYTALARHQQIHSSERRYKCHICNKAFKYHNVLKDHVRIHTGERPWSCEICGLGFKQRSAKKIHIENVHNAEKNFKCHQCDRKFVNKIYLERHVTRIHSENPPRYGPCSVCDKSFTTEYALRKHKNVHNGINQCHVCGKCFVTEKSLANHMQTYQGQKPFRCGHCGKYFHSKTTAKQHILDHVDGKEEKSQRKKDEGRSEMIRVEIFVDIDDLSSESEDELDLVPSGGLINHEETTHQGLLGLRPGSATSSEGTENMQFDNVQKSCDPYPVQASEIVDNDELIMISDFFSEKNAGTLLGKTSEFSDSVLGGNDFKNEDFTVGDYPTGEGKPHAGYILTSIQRQQGVVQPITFSQPESLGEDLAANAALSTWHIQNYLNKNHDVKQKEICETCGKATSNMRAHLRYHKTNLNPDKQMEICETCGKAVSNMRTHIRIHKQTPVRCEQCGKMLSCKGSLFTHLKTHGEKKFECPVCGKKCVTKIAVGIHMKKHSEGNLECHYCFKKFKWHGSLIAHVRMHTNEKPYACRICGRKFRHTNARLDHERIHTGERPHVCNVCGKSFTQRSSLRSHWHTHSTEKRFECEICQKKFARKNGYKQHLKRHGERNKFHCQICGSDYSAASALRKHMTWHRKFGCSSCRRRFSTKEELEKHERKFKDIQPSACGVCGKMFHWKTSANRHMETHTGRGKGIECFICMDQFSSERELSEHKAEFCDQKPFSCAHCGKMFHSKELASKHVLSHVESGQEEKTNLSYIGVDTCSIDAALSKVE